MIQLIQGDCLTEMQKIQSCSVDAIITDPPYGTTACKWDSIIPFEPMWEQLKRVIKPNGAIVMTASQPFTSVLVSSNLKMFKYELIWEKDNATGHLDSKFRPLRKHENILVFSDGAITWSGRARKMSYNPQMTEGKPYEQKSGRGSELWQQQSSVVTKNNGNRFPVSIQKIDSDRSKLHPTQKPVALMEYLIKTYTNEGETVLDFTMGSGTTGVACKNLNRGFIGIEQDPNYFKIAEERINKHDLFS